LVFQTSIGIHVDGRRVSMACLKASLTGVVKVTAHDIYTLNETQPLEEKVGAIEEVVRNFLAKNDVSQTGIFFGIPREKATLRYVELPLAAKENLEDSLGYEMEKYFPFSGDEIYFDYQVISENKKSGKMKILVVVAKKESIDPYIGLADRLGMELSSIEISSTALANYFSCQSPIVDGRDNYALVYLMDERLEFGFLSERFLIYSKFIKRAEKEGSLKESVSQELKILKEAVGQDQGQLKTVFCGFDLGEVESPCNFTGNEDIETHLPDILKAGFSSYAVMPAYGLALKGIQKVPMNINLLPDEFQKKTTKTAYYTMFVLLGLLILSVIAWGGGNVFFQHLKLSRLNSEISLLQSEAANISRFKEKCKEIEDRINFLVTLRTNSVSALNVLKELSTRVPKGAWVRSFSYSEKDVQIVGFADSASELIPSLESSPIFKDVSFLSAIIRDRDGKELFRIGLKVNLK
jgi:Tfp pilus assembly protein PilN